MTMMMLRVQGQLVSNFLPTTYSSPVPILYSETSSTYDLQLNLCNDLLYAGCEITAVLDIPFEPWVYYDGIYVEYSVIGGNNCDLVMCSNNITSSSPSNCSFFYPGNASQTLYMVSQSGSTAELTGTFSLRINCSTTGTTNFTSYDGQCPLDPVQSVQNIRTTSPGQVATSGITHLNYTLIVCSALGDEVGLVYTLEATNQDSAFASYICLTAPCSVPRADFKDESGSAFNTITVPPQSINTGSFVYLLIFGWGDFQGENDFVFNIQVTDSSAAAVASNATRKMVSSKNSPAKIISI
jgi:hypothetical protein